MSGHSFSPRFVRAKVSFTFENKVYQAGEHLINSQGVPGFHWSIFDPVDNLGKRAQVSVQVQSATPWEFTCAALFGCEQSGAGSATALGLNFLMSPPDRAKLDTVVATEGEYPDYVRKFPRIHYVDAVPVFPNRVIVKFFYNHEDISVCCELDNLSPTGIQVFTEDSRTGALLPNETVRVQIQPRGTWLRCVATNAQVKRVILSVDPVTGNVRRFFGLGITTMSAEAKVNFTDLMRQIISQSKPKVKAAA